MWAKVRGLEHRVCAFRTHLIIKSFRCCRSKRVRNSSPLMVSSVTTGFLLTSLHTSRALLRNCSMSEALYQISSWIASGRFVKEATEVVDAKRLNETRRRRLVPVFCCFIFLAQCALGVCSITSSVGQHMLLLIMMKGGPKKRYSLSSAVVFGVCLRRVVNLWAFAVCRSFASLLPLSWTQRKLQTETTALSNRG